MKKQKTFNELKGKLVLKVWDRGISIDVAIANNTAKGLKKLCNIMTEPHYKGVWMKIELYT